ANDPRRRGRDGAARARLRRRRRCARRHRPSRVRQARSGRGAGAAAPPGTRLRLLADPRRGGRARGGHPLRGDRVRVSAVTRTLILGGAGFIGCHLAQRLADEGHELTLVDDFSRGRDDTVLAALRARPNVACLTRDLTRPDALTGLGREWAHVYMLAAVVGVRNVEQDPARVVRVNTLALLHLLDWLPGAGEVLFFASTSETYAGGVLAGSVPVPRPEAVTRLVATPPAWGSVVNVGNDTEETRIEDLAALVLRAADFRPRLLRGPAPAGSVPRRCPDLTRLRTLTGFAPKVPLEDGVRETVAWYRTWSATSPPGGQR